MYMCTAMTVVWCLADLIWGEWKAGLIGMILRMILFELLLITDLSTPLVSAEYDSVFINSASPSCSLW